jgi:predicted acylesterase/phospholipase RssA
MSAATTRCEGNDVDLTAEAARLPRGVGAAGLPACDLVMKGGVTSGVVYPGAVIALAKSFRFASLGGTSAGAIAAGVCAAGEYGRLRDSGTGLAELGAVSRDFSKEGFIPGLFQPTPGAARLMGLALLAMQHPKDSKLRRMLRIAIAAFGKALVVALIAVVWIGGLGLLAWGAIRGFGEAVSVPLMLLVAAPLALLVPLLAALTAFARVAVPSVKSLRKSNYGACPGMPQTGSPPSMPVLTDWLHERVQTAAGRLCTRRDQVLTVDELRRSGIVLETMTTDLSRARPLRCPVDLGGYCFKPREMLEVFPRPVVARMIQPDPAAPEPDDALFEADCLCPLDPQRLPVLVAIRLSLSFPVLLSAIPLYRSQNGGEATRSLLSDGGISSNFPVQFFDAWFPSRPTFGIDLDSHPGGSAPFVVMHGDAGAHVPREIAGAGAFAAQIIDTMQNWRDNLQAELPSYRDRVCDVRFSPGEGGLNLKMKPPEVAILMQRGYRAGELLARTLPMTAPPHPPSGLWSRHCLTRYELLMRLQQEGLKSVDERTAGFLAALDDGELTPPDRDPWARSAAGQTKALLRVVRPWGPKGPVDFTGTPPPRPEPVMRIVPKG